MKRFLTLGVLVVGVAAVAGLGIFLYPRFAPEVSPSLPATPRSGSASIAGRVLDVRTQSGIPDIEVALLSAAKAGDGKETVLETGSVKSSASGLYRFDGLNAGSYRLYPKGRSAGYLPLAKGPVALTLAAGERKEEVVLPLEPGSTVEGLVRDRDGKPVEKTSVAAIPLDWKGPIDEEIAELSTEAGADGQFRIAGLYPGKPYRLRGKAQGWAVSASEPFTTPRDPKPARIDVPMKHGSRVSGVARYADGKPAAGYALDLFAQTDGLFVEPKSGATDAEGRFAFERVSAGTYLIDTPAGPGRTGPETNAEPVRLTLDGEQALSDVAVTVAGLPGAQQAPAMSGVVLDAHDVLVPEAHVEAHATQGGPDVATATTDASGAFAVKGLKGQVYQVVAVTKDACAFEGQVPADSRLTLRVQPRVRVTGKATNEQNLPVANAKVWMAPAQEMPILPELMAQLNPNAEQQSDDSGGFTFDVGAFGRYTVRASDAGGNTGECTAFSVGADATPPVIHVIIAQPSRFTGQIIDMRSVPVGDVAVELTPLGAPAGTEPVSATKTDASGMFTFDDVPQGLYILRASHEGYADTCAPNIRIVRGQRIADYRLIMTMGGGIRGVFTAGNMPQEGVTIQVHNDIVQREVKTDREGRFLFQSLPAGSYTVTPAGLAPPTGSLQPVVPVVANVTEGNVAEVSLGVAIGLPVMGVVGNVKPGYATLVRVIRPGAVVPLDLSTAAAQGVGNAVNNLVAQGVAGPDGSFQLDGVALGRYTLEVFALPFHTANPDMSTITDADRIPKIQQEIIVENQPAILNLALP